MDMVLEKKETLGIEISIGSGGIGENKIIRYIIMLKSLSARNLH